MTAQKYRILSLKPIVLDDNRRTLLELAVDGLPQTGGGGFCGINGGDSAAVMFFPEPETAVSPPANEDYPDVELSILNSQREPVASMFIVQHREAVISMTLHIPRPNPDEQYIARAELIQADEIIDVVEAPFSLHR
ncbi:MAG: hypothetical protein D6784_04105 [Chloroflexi bacterium]|nr:MAG: hypothetical protein D6784_04105 [Chloroflexota bacterium]